MHIEYRVTVPDHDWVIASRHKLIPPVYAAIEVNKDSLRKPMVFGHSAKLPEGELQVPNTSDHKNLKFPSLFVGRAINFDDIVSHLTVVY